MWSQRRSFVQTKDAICKGCNYKCSEVGANVFVCISRRIYLLPQEELSDLDSDQQLATFEELVVPADLPADIRAKLIVVLVHLDALHLIQDLCQQFLEAEIEDFGDLVIDIVEAMMKMEKWESALPLLLLASTSEK